MQRMTVLVAIHFLCLLSMAPAGQAASPTSYTFTLLDHPAAPEYTYPIAINNKGQIVGFYDEAQTGLHNFIWTRRGGYTVFTGPPGSVTRPTGINDLGSVVGYDSASYINHGFVWDVRNGFNTLDVPFATQSVAGGGTHLNNINDDGKITGTYVDDIGVHGFIWDSRSGFITINSPMDHVFSYGGCIVPVYINNAAILAGSYYYSIDYHSCGFMWSGAKGITTLAFPEAIETYIGGINDLGRIWGLYNLAPDSFHSFVWDSQNGFVTFNFPSASATYVRGMNDRGQMAGSYALNNGEASHGFVWDKANGFTTLDVPCPTGLTCSTSIGSINNLGQVMGSYWDGTASHNFMASPTQPPDFKVVNNRTAFQVLPATYSTVPCTQEWCPTGFQWVFCFDARLTNTGKDDLSNLVVRVNSINGGNLLLNANDGPAGTGVWMSIPHKDQLADAVLRPGESVDVSFEIGLRQKAPFRFGVDILKLVD